MPQSRSSPVRRARSAEVGPLSRIHAIVEARASCDEPTAVTVMRLEIRHRRRRAFRRHARERAHRGDPGARARGALRRVAGPRMLAAGCETSVSDGAAVGHGVVRGVRPLPGAGPGPAEVGAAIQRGSARRVHRCGCARTSTSRWSSSLRARRRQDRSSSSVRRCGPGDATGSPRLRASRGHDARVVSVRAPAL